MHRRYSSLSPSQDCQPTLTILGNAALLQTIPPPRCVHSSSSPRSSFRDQGQWFSSHFLDSSTPHSFWRV
jgi:hypothetical protein